MSLRSRLFLSYLGLVAVFCGVGAAVLLAAWPGLVGGTPDFHPGELAPPTAFLAARSFEEGGLAEVERRFAIPGEALPPDAWITLYRPDGTWRVLIGEEKIGQPEEVAAAFRGQGTLQPGPLGMSATAPLRDSRGRVFAVVSAEFGTGPARLRRPLLWRQVSAVALALAAALASSLLVAWTWSRALSAPLARLVAGLERMAPGRLSERLPETGPLETRELSRSFNHLARQLEGAIEDLRGQREQAEELADSKRQFLADVSHNLRTPLTAVYGWLDSLKDGLVPPEEVGPQLDRIQKEVAHISRTVEWLLDLARWEGQDPKLHRESFPILEVVMEVAETLEEAALEAEVSLQFDGLDPEWRVQADRARTREIFQILLENGVQHAGPGVTLHLSMAPGDGWLAVEVRDNGVGFPPEGRPSRTAGSGLGLAIAGRLVRAHGGEMEVESAEGKGTRVRFTLPVPP